MFRCCLMSAALGSFVVVGSSISGFAADWPQWGGTPHRNMVSDEKGLPVGLDSGDAQQAKSMTEPLSGGNVKWVVKLGVQTHGSPTVADGRVFIGTNNPRARDGTIAHTDDAGGRLLCLDQQTGKLLWELATPKLPERRAPHSDNGYGVCSSVTIEGNRAYVVNNRTDVLCLDVEGLANGNDGPYLDEAHYLAGLNDSRQRPPPKVELQPTMPTSSGVTISLKNSTPTRTMRPPAHLSSTAICFTCVRATGSTAQRPKCSIRWRRA